MLGSYEQGSSHNGRSAYPKPANVAVTLLVVRFPLEGASHFGKRLIKVEDLFGLLHVPIDRDETTNEGWVSSLGGRKVPMGMDFLPPPSPDFLFWRIRPSEVRIQLACLRREGE